jgi:hypothetical protein
MQHIVRLKGLGQVRNALFHVKHCHLGWKLGTSFQSLEQYTVHEIRSQRFATTKGVKLRNSLSLLPKT